MQIYEALPFQNLLPNQTPKYHSNVTDWSASGDSYPCTL